MAAEGFPLDDDAELGATDGTLPDAAGIGRELLPLPPLLLTADELGAEMTLRVVLLVELDEEFRGGDIWSVRAGRAK